MNGILLAALLSLQTADVSTSCVGFGRGHMETNPVVPTSCVGAATMTAAADTGLVWFTQKKIKTRWKRALVYGSLASIETFVLARNVARMHSPVPQHGAPVSYECGSLIGVPCR